MTRRASLPFQSVLANTRGLRYVLALTLINGVLPGFAAQQEEVRDQSVSVDTRWLVSVAAGSSSDNSNAWRIAATKPWQRRWLDGGSAHLTGYWEASVALFENDVRHVPADDGTAYLWNVAIAPVLRLQFTLGDNFPVQPFLDLGVGVSFMSDREFRTGKQRSRPLGSYFQFEDRGAVGAKIGDWEIAYQRMHYSNLDFASENNGIDAHLLLLRRAIGKR